MSSILHHTDAASADICVVVSSAIVDKYIGESARLIREMFGYAKEHEPCIIFMDEIDAIGGRRFSEGTSADREIQRTLMELLNQLDGFDYLGKTKIIMATNRPDTLDPALLRAGRLDRKIEIPLPNEAGRLEVLKIHAMSVQKEGEIDFESVVKMSDGLNGADLRNVVTEAGLFAIKDYRESVSQDDFNKAVRKVAESKKLEGKMMLFTYVIPFELFANVACRQAGVPEVVKNLRSMMMTLHDLALSMALPGHGRARSKRFAWPIVLYLTGSRNAILYCTHSDNVLICSANRR